MSEMLKVLVVDDSLVYRNIVSQALKKVVGTALLGFARDGVDLLEKLSTGLKPDLITLDIEMPRLNGVETLKQIKSKYPQIPVVMLSALTQVGARETIQALALGAHSFIPKPEDPSQKEEVIQSLQKIVDEINTIRGKSSLIASMPEHKVIQKSVSRVVSPKSFAKPKVVVIGVSTGGPKALMSMLPKLPESLKVPILIVQHMPEGFTKAFADNLNKICRLNVCEAQDNESLKAGSIYIAPGKKQMKVVATGAEEFGRIRLTDDKPECFSKPSVDYLFRSVASVFKEKALGVIMTGMGKDGTLGLKLMKRHGCQVLGQSKETCTVYGMPNSAFLAGVVDREIPLESLAKEIVGAL